MIELLAAAGTAMAWFGATVLALSEARRGLALGLAVTGLGLGLATGGVESAAALLALATGGVVAGGLRLRDGPPGWGLLASASTPQIVISLASLAASVLIGGTVLGGPGGAVRVAALSAASIAGIRLVTVRGRSPALASASALALAFGALGTVGTALAAAFVALALGALPGSDRREVGA